MKLSKEMEVFDQSIPMFVENYEQHRDLLISLINTKGLMSNGAIKLLIIQLCDRIISGAENALLIIRNHPSFSAIDIATLNRSIFESAVNILYILTDDSEARFMRYSFSSIDADLKIVKNCKEWVKPCVQKDIETGAQQYIKLGSTSEGDKQKLSDIAGISVKSVKSLPDVRQRCKLIGDIWLYFYDTRYRETSGWSHGSMSRIFVSPYHQAKDKNIENKSIMESLSMLSWTTALIHQLVVHLANYTTSHAVVENAINIGIKFTEAIDKILCQSTYVNVVDEK